MRRLHRSITAVSAQLLIVLGVAACGDPAGPVANATGAADTLVIKTAPDFVGVVTRNMHEEGWTPAGFWMDQYAVWVAIPPSDTGDAGVVVGRLTPVFVSNRFGLARAASGGSIVVGDSIHVWHDQTVGYGAVEAPTGAPCYEGTQIVVFP